LGRMFRWFAHQAPTILFRVRCAWRIIDLVKNAKQPVFLVCVSDQALSLKKPTQIRNCRRGQKIQSALTVTGIAK
jgi:hypothetical protein